MAGERWVPRGPGGVRGVFWALLAGALLLALALPVASLWRAASSALDVRACVWPAAPRLGAPARLVVVLPDAADRAAVHGPWARLVAEWDMAAMSMGARRATISGPLATAREPAAFAVPLHLDMAGAWAARIVLSTPGRPAWETTLRFTVLAPATAAAPGARASPAPTSPGCEAGGAAREGGRAP
jgi:hypothetical protein